MMDGQLFVRCPFNPQHVTSQRRIQQHIVKCQVNYPGYKMCPYNATHRFPEDQLREHLEVCPQKANFFKDKQLASVENYFKHRQLLQENVPERKTIKPPQKVSSHTDPFPKPSSSRIPLVQVRPMFTQQNVPEHDPYHESWDD